MYKIIRTVAFSSKDFMDGIPSYEEAYKICETYNWEYQEEFGGFCWDLVIIEE